MVNETTEQNLKAALHASQAWWEDMGVEVPIPPPTQTTEIVRKPTAKRPQATLAPQETATETGLADRVSKATSIAKAAPTLEALQQALSNFDSGVLSDNAQNMVFARGNAEASVMAIGESPGRQEDATGLPFVGLAGQLLDKMFAAIQHDETNLYITNVCNWRPPGNRNPNEDELAICKPFIERHIELISPKIIVIVGGISLQALTGKTGIMKSRGRWIDLDINGTTIPALPIYHPAFLLRRPELKKQAWHDLLALQNRINSPT